jgi:hypothetical protein
MPDCSGLQQALDDLLRTKNDDLADCGGEEDPRIRGQCRKAVLDRIAQAQEALRNCELGLPDPGIQSASGRVSFLRVNDGGFGPPGDFLDAEVIFMLDTQPGRAFGVKLENPAREGMLGLLRDAFTNSFNASIDYNQVLGKFNAIAFRIALTR